MNDKFNSYFCRRLIESYEIAPRDPDWDETIIEFINALITRNDEIAAQKALLNKLADALKRFCFGTNTKYDNYCDFCGTRLDIGHQKDCKMFGVDELLKEVRGE